MSIAGTFERFQYFKTFKQILWKTQVLFKKLECRFLVESTKTERAIFPYKNALSEATVKTNNMGSTKWTYYSNYFSFLKICFSLRTSYKGLIWCNDHPNVHIHIFWKCWSFILGCFFPGLFPLKKTFLWHNFTLALKKMRNHIVNL